MWRKGTKFFRVCQNRDFIMQPSTPLPPSLRTLGTYTRWTIYQVQRTLKALPLNAEGTKRPSYPTISSLQGGTGRVTFTDCARDVRIKAGNAYRSCFL